MVTLSRKICVKCIRKCEDERERERGRVRDSGIKKIRTKIIQYVKEGVN